jgi:hypothetical protein
MYPPHITVVRKGKESPNTINFEKFDKRLIKYFYSPVIHEGDVYFWLNAYSSDIEEIREELGLTNGPWNDIIAPLPFKKTLHITLGNKKF